MVTLTGPDVSYVQGNYHAPPSDEFVIANSSRANIGLAVGSYYQTQIDNAIADAKERGHYFFNGNINPTVCADFFCANLHRLTAGDVLVLDVESEPGTGTVAWNPAQVLAFAQRVYSITGVKITVYLNQSLMLNNNWSAVVAFGCTLWIAYYSSSLPSIAYWPKASIWQHTSTPIDSNIAWSPLAQIAGNVTPPIPIVEEVMTYSFVKDAHSSTIFVVNLNSGLRAGVQSQGHLNLLKRVKVNNADDPMLVAELDIVHAYLKAIEVDWSTMPPVTVTVPNLDAAALAKAIAAGLNIPAHFNLTLTGKADAA